MEKEDGMKYNSLYFNRTQFVQIKFLNLKDEFSSLLISVYDAHVKLF